MQRYELSGDERLPANITILVYCWFNVGLMLDQISVEWSNQDVNIGL